MKLGFLSVMYSDRSLKDVLELVRPLGLESIELGTRRFRSCLRPNRSAMN